MTASLIVVKYDTKVTNIHINRQNNTTYNQKTKYMNAGYNIENNLGICNCNINESQKL